MISLKLRFSLIASATTLSLATAVPADASQVNITFSFESFTSKLDLSIPPGVPPSPLPTVVVGGQTVASYTPDVPFTVTRSFGQSVDFHEVTISGEQTHNVVQFTPGPGANVTAGQEFLLGTFHLVDGIWFGGADIAFNMLSVSADPALNGHQYSDTLRMVFNPFDPNPDKSADWFYLVNQRAGAGICGTAGGAALVQCNSLRVYELFDSPITPHVDGVSNAGDIELWGAIGSLDPIEFKNPQGGLFVSKSFDTDPNLATTPLPAAFPLFASGLGALGLLGWRRKRKGAAAIAA
jgi:hypothetical protein